MGFGAAEVDLTRDYAILNAESAVRLESRTGLVALAQFRQKLPVNGALLVDAIRRGSISDN
jgi:hypothetical protein